MFDVVHSRRGVANLMHLYCHLMIHRANLFNSLIRFVFSIPQLTTTDEWYSILKLGTCDQFYTVTYQRLLHTIVISRHVSITVLKIVIRKYDVHILDTNIPFHHI